MPPLPVLAALAEYYGISLAELLTETADEGTDGPPVASPRRVPA
jgi:hypothetical protein